jgi:hypothetical protein
MKERLSFYEFVQAVAERISADLGSDYKVDVTKVSKNNGLVLQGVCIRYADNNIAPVIYLMDYHRTYVNGRGMDDVIADIIQTYKNSNKNMPSARGFDWGDIKDRVVIRLINYDIRYRCISMKNEIPFDNYIRIDNSNLSPEEAAKKIKETFLL